MGRHHRWVAGFAALTVLAACGSSAAKGAAPTKVDITTWRAGTESGTAKIAGRTTTVTDGKPDQVQVSEGVVDFDRHRYSSKSRITTGPHAGREFETRQIDDTTYWWDPSPDGPGGAAKPWTRSELPWQAGAWTTMLDRAFTNPRATVTPTGTETVRGTEVTNYRITYPPRVPPKLVARGYPKGLTGLEIAVDADQRVRRVRFSVQTTTGSVSHQEIELYDAGTPVSVEAPPADQIDTSVTSTGRPVATGPWTDLATDGDGADRVIVSAVPTQDGTCLRLAGTQDRNDSWVVAGRATFTCLYAGNTAFDNAEVFLYPVGTDLQIVTGQFDRSTTEVTLHLEDGSTVKASPSGGAFAAIVHGDHVVERVDAPASAGKTTCDFAPARTPLIYQCRSDVAAPAFAGDPLPFDPTAPPTAPPTTTPRG